MTKSRDNHDGHNPGRRKFLKGVGIAGAGAAIADHLWTDAEAQEKQPATLSGNVKITLHVNGTARDVQVEPRTTLLNAMRNHLDPAVTGPKLVCDVGSPDSPNAVQAAFVGQDALMCGFCTPGFVTTISAYLKKNPNPSLAEVREACKGNFCRCGTYPRVFEAALAAAKSTAG